MTDDEDLGLVGHCHRYAPKPQQWHCTGDVDVDAEAAARAETGVKWPMVVHSDFCGEFAPSAPVVE